MFDQYQGMMDSWKVLQRFDSSIPGSGHQHPLLWAEGLAQPAHLAPTHSQLRSALPIHSSGLRLGFQTPESWGSEKPRSHPHRVGGQHGKTGGGGAVESD